MLDIVYLIVGIAIGVVATWLVFKNKTSIDPRAAELDRQNASLSTEVRSLKELKQIQDADFREEKSKAETILKTERDQVRLLTDQLARKESELRSIEQRLQENKAELENLQERFTKEFENLANKIFEEKSKKFTEQNKTQIDDILKPLGEKIKDFEKRVNEVYSDETKERTGLKQQLVELLQKNQQLSKDAQNLTSALKGENKSAGNWGEYILQSILEKSGLRKDEQYRAQKSFTSEDGKIYQPDVIIDLPGNKNLVVDSKVSLVAYERFASAESEEEKTLAIKEHVASVRKHIKDLSEKNYQKIYQLNTLDFILLFMPIEPAFSAALQNDRELFNFAFDKNIVIVSPTTLLATLRTVDNFWKQELQNRNVLQIADEAAAMYEKFVGFTESMIDVGKRMDDSKKSYETAMNRLSTGSGNVVRRIENLKKLGLKVSKSIDPKLIERSNENELTSEDEK
ncbi:MAG: DNA recombination protein RmuC [Bacteroidetes bacterium]|nr:DNA recombination protein RmuC [Bacteroidota bacterium]